jgi:hypothetical protein
MTRHSIFGADILLTSNLQLLINAGQQSKRLTIGSALTKQNGVVVVAFRKVMPGAVVPDSPEAWDAL